MKVFSFLIAILLVAQMGYALSLEEMQAMALSQREIVKRSEVDVERSKRDIAIARAGYYPSVDLSYNLSALDDPSFSEDEENSFVSGSVSLNLFKGFRDKYSVQSAQLVKEVERHQLTALRQDIQLNVALRYLDVYERRANLEVAEKNLQTLTKIYRDGKSRLEVGLIDRNELLKFKVDMEDSDIVVKTARADLEKSVQLLSREIGTPLELSHLIFTEFEGTPQVEDPEENEQKMLVKRSELLALGKLVEASEYTILTEKSDYYPEVDLLGSYTQVDDDLVVGKGDFSEDELRAQLVVSLNLFNGFATQESVAKARLENRGLKYDKVELEDTLKTELKNLHIDYEVSLRNIDVALGNIESAEESLRVTKLKYDEGLERESELLDAITNLSRAQFNHVAVLRTAFLNRFQILRMIEAFGDRK